MSWNVIDVNKVEKDSNVTVLLDYTAPYSELRFGVGEGCKIYQAGDKVIENVGQNIWIWL